MRKISFLIPGTKSRTKKSVWNLVPGMEVPVVVVYNGGSGGGVKIKNKT